MRLTEIIFLAAVLLTLSSAFTSGFLTVRKSLLRAGSASENAVRLLETDRLLRKAVNECGFSWWKDFDRELEEKRSLLEKGLREKNIEVTGVQAVHDKRNGRCGIQVEWTLNGKTYAAREFIRGDFMEEYR